MDTLIARTWKTPLMGGTLLILPAAAQANIPVPSLVGLGPPFYLPLPIVLLAFAAIVIIESLVLSLFSRAGLMKCLLLVLAANLVSSFAGLILAFGHLIFIGLFFFGCIFLFTRMESEPRLYNPRFLAFVFVPTSILVLWAGYTYSSGRALQSWAVYGSLIPAFVASVFLEYGVLKILLREETNLFLKLALANIPSYIMLFALMLGFSFDPKENPMIDPWYLHITAQSLARQGKAEDALESVELTWEDVETGRFGLENNLETADILARRGHDREARTILERAKTVDYSNSLYGEEITRRIQSLQNLLDEHAKANRGSGP